MIEQMFDHEKIGRRRNIRAARGVKGPWDPTFEASSPF